MQELYNNLKIKEKGLKKDLNNPRIKGKTRVIARLELKELDKITCLIYPFTKYIKYFDDKYKKNNIDDDLKIRLFNYFSRLKEIEYYKTRNIHNINIKNKCNSNLSYNMIVDYEIEELKGAIRTIELFIDD